MSDPIKDKLDREAAAAADLMGYLRDDGVDLDDETAATTIEGETSLFEAVAAAIDEIDRCEIIAAGCKAKEADIAKRRGNAERRAERVCAMIERAMQEAGQKTIPLPLATVTLKDVKPRPVVRDESLIPAGFWKTPDPVLDRAALNKAAKTDEIPGVEMSNGGVSLQIRRL